MFSLDYFENKKKNVWEGRIHQKDLIHASLGGMWQSPEELPKKEPRQKTKI